MSPLERSILQTIAYFDVFDYPLTLSELRRYLWKLPAPDDAELIATVEALPMVQWQDALISLRGNIALTDTRAERYLETERKWRRRWWFLRWLSILPGVEALFVVNSMAHHNAQADSDIDLLIITKPKKIWSTRFVTTVTAQLLGLRPRPGKTRDQLCLSFYITADALDLSGLLLEPNDRHQAYWLSQWYPVYDPKDYLTKVWQANTWLQQLLPNAEPVASHPQRVISQTWLHRLDTPLIYLLPEGLLSWLQLKVLPKRLHDLSHGDKPIVILSKTLLKFHTRDPRPELKQEFEQRLHQTSLPPSV